MFVGMVPRFVRRASVRFIRLGASEEAKSVYWYYGWKIGCFVLYSCGKEIIHMWVVMDGYSRTCIYDTKVYLWNWRSIFWRSLTEDVCMGSKLLLKEKDYRLLDGSLYRLVSLELKNSFYSISDYQVNTMSIWTARRNNEKKNIITVALNATGTIRSIIVYCRCLRIAPVDFDVKYNNFLYEFHYLAKEL